MTCKALILHHAELTKQTSSDNHWAPSQGSPICPDTQFDSTLEVLGKRAEGAALAVNQCQINLVHLPRVLSNLSNWSD